MMMKAIATMPIVRTCSPWSIAHARKRLPIEASAKCSGTRSGVSMIRTSSVASVADMFIQIEHEQTAAYQLSVSQMFPDPTLLLHSPRSVVLHQLKRHPVGSAVVLPLSTQLSQP